MAAVSVLAVEQGWAGDRKRHHAALLVANASTVTPAMVGLQKIEAVVPNELRAGTFPIGSTSVTLTDHGTHVISWYTDTVAFALQTTANSLWYFYGW